MSNETIVLQKLCLKTTKKKVYLLVSLLRKINIKTTEL